MSKERKVPPIQPEPFRPFTVRLVKGHFVRVPRVGNPGQTDTTRPPTDPLRKTVPYGDGAVVGRNLRLDDGRFVSDADRLAEPVAAKDGTAGLEDMENLTVEFLDRRAPVPKAWPPR